MKDYVFTESGKYLIIAIDFTGGSSNTADIQYSTNIKCTEISKGRINGIGTNSSYFTHYGLYIVEANVGDVIGNYMSSAVGIIILKL